MRLTGINKTKRINICIYGFITLSFLIIKGTIISKITVETTVNVENNQNRKRSTLIFKNRINYFNRDLTCCHAHHQLAVLYFTIYENYGLV